jgi:3-oxoadipate enol-lactonase
MFVHQVAALRDQYRVITWDERGFGAHRVRRPAVHLLGLRERLPRSDDHLGIERAVVGGMSQGGYLSLRVALTAPERVRALILLDSGARARRARDLAANQGMVDMWLAVGPVDDLARPWPRSSSTTRREPDVDRQVAGAPEGTDGRARSLPAHPRRREQPRLGEITCPALVVHGTEDTAITMEHAEEMAAGLVGCGGVVKVGGAHAANLTNPEPVNAAILDFLAGLPA